MSWKKEKERLLELRLRWKLWEAVFHRPYGCKNKWCLYKDLGSEKTVIKQELRSLSSPLLSSYRRQKPSKPFLLGPCEFCRGRARQNWMEEWRGVCVCVLCVQREKHLHSQSRSMQSGVTSMILLSLALTTRCVFVLLRQVTPRKKFKCPECTAIDGLSLDQTHMVERWVSLLPKVCPSFWSPFPALGLFMALFLKYKDSSW